MPRAARILHWILVGILGLSGVVLALLGGFLVYLGGSAYYVAAGAVSLYVAYLMARGRALAAPVYGSLLAVTVVWALYESDLVFLSLLPRLAFWLVLGLWFITPWYRRSLQEGAQARPATYVVPALAAVALLAAAALAGYEVNGEGTYRERVASEPVTDWRHYGNTTGGTRFAELD
ncbi:MAG: pyrroloquinoline quinone-dependent dehydrogenase, partial [Halioglobus sp.]|nr:pyrroloquinoline quinone-dependent dehydrogenase [Halioglobus sp.]